MKTIFQQGLLLVSIILSVCSCETQDDSIGIDFKAEEAKAKSLVLTCDDLLNAPEDFEGQVIKLDAINWGTRPSVDENEILMSIDDNALKGLQQAHVLVHFSKEQEDEIKGIEENDSISLTAKVGAFEFGALRLLEAKITPN